MHECGHTREEDWFKIFRFTICLNDKIKCNVFPSFEVKINKEKTLFLIEFGKNWYKCIHNRAFAEWMVPVPCFWTNKVDFPWCGDRPRAFFIQLNNFEIPNFRIKLNIQLKWTSYQITNYHHLFTTRLTVGWTNMWTLLKEKEIISNYNKLENSCKESTHMLDA